MSKNERTAEQKREDRRLKTALIREKVGLEEEQGNKIADTVEVIEKLQALRLDTSNDGKDSYKEGKRYGFNEGINKAIRAVIEVSQGDSK